MPFLYCTISICLVYKVLVIIGIIALLSSCSFKEKSEHEILSEIYSDSLPYEYTHRSSDADYCKNKSVNIASFTEGYPYDETDWAWANTNMPPLEQDTWANFFQVNSQQIPFPSDLDLQCKYTLVDKEEIQAGSPPENCIRIITFSQIGFNSQKNQALFYRNVSCGDFGYGNLYFAEIVDGSWTITGMAEVFMD